MITAENVLAAAEGTPTRLAVTVRSAAAVGGLAFALDRGVDALVVSAEDIRAKPGAELGGALLDAAQIAKAQRLERDGHVDGVAPPPPVDDAARVTLGGGVVVGVSDGGVGDRVALDFTSMLRDDEGCAEAAP